jgi:hypothetical protein
VNVPPPPKVRVKVPELCGPEAGLPSSNVTLCCDAPLTQDQVTVVFAGTLSEMGEK